MVGARFLRDLPSHLRGAPLSLASTHGEIALRLAARERDLLDRVRDEVVARPYGVVARLLEHAGVEGGDLAGIVSSAGVEGALARLYRAGVYLTSNEFKGREPLVRGSLVLGCRPESLRNPRARFHVQLGTSGSRGPRTPMLVDLAFVRDTAVDSFAALAAWGIAGASAATWEVPGGGALFRLLEFAAFGTPPERWFSQLALDAPRLHARYRWSAYALRLGGRAAGVPMPVAEHVPLDAPEPIARWLAAEVARGRTPLLFTFPSSAMRVAEAAGVAGLDLTGAWTMVSGEPITPPRLAVIRRAGLAVVPRYGSIETAAIGYGCPLAGRADEMHLLADQHAVVTAGESDTRGLPAGALLLTGLRASAPFVFLNLSIGDRATFVDGRCGCALERLGWTTRFHTVRSFEKLTGAGMTFGDADLVAILERDLPRRFGGGAADYQLAELEDTNGSPRLALRVHPRLGALDEAAVAEAFLDAVGQGSGVERAMELVWRDARLVTVERLPPAAGFTGKVLHYHRAAAANAAPPSPADPPA